MTATVSPAAAVSRPYPSSRYFLTFGRILGSEWVKFRSVRSTVWTLLITVVVMIGFAAMFAGVWASNSTDMANDPSVLAEGGIVTVTIGVGFAQLAVAVLGALTITGEYSTGMIRSTFSSVPGRTSALLAKALMLVIVTFIVTGIAIVISCLVTAPMLSGTPFALDLSDGSTVRALLGVPLYLAGIAALSLAVGTLVRNSAGAIFSLVALLLILPGVFSSVPLDWLRTLSDYLPSSAGAQVMITNVSDTGLAPWTGFAVLVAWVVVLLGGALVVARRRDA